MRATAVAGGGADPFYVRVLAEDARAGELTTAASPAGLDRYLDAWWRDVEADLFGLLAVARGPIGRCELAQLLEGFDADAIPRRFVAGDDRGYSLVHPRLREYLRERLDTERHEQRLLEYCRAHRSPYVLEHFASHLAERGLLEELQRLVLGGEWYEVAGVEHYLRDVRLTWRLSEGSPGVETRCALAVASVNSLAGSVPPALAAALVAAGEWTRERALAYARQIPDAGQRAETLVALLDGDERTRQEALDAAEAAVRPHSESIYMNAPDPWVPGRHGVRIFAPPREPGFRALAELRPSQTVLERALDAWDEHWTRTGDPQPGALALLAPLLGPELLEEALEIVRGHADDAPDGWSGPETAACFAVLGAAEEAIDAALREAKLSGFTAVMPLAPSGELVQAGLQAALEREHQAFYRSLMALDPSAGPFEGYVSDEDRVAWISTVPGPADELLVCLDSEAHRAWVGGDFERALELGGARTELLTAIAPELPEPLIGRWLALLGESRPDCGDVHRARAAALAALARRAPDARLEEVLWVSAGLRDPAPALQALAPRLPRPLLAEAARITGVIGDQRARAKALAALGERRRAVEVALEDPEWWRDEALFDELAPDLDTAQLERALVGAARDPVVARRLEHWLARVEPGEEGAALRAVHAVADPEVRAAALAALVPLLPEERLAEAAAEAEALPGPERVIASLPLVLRAPPAQQLDAAQELAAVFHAVETYDGAWLRALARFAVALPEPDASAWADVALGLIDQFPRGDDDAFRALELLASRATGVLERVGRFSDYRQSLLLTALAERAPEQVLARALEIANPWYRARVLPALDQFDLALETLVEAAPDNWGDIETFGDPGSYAFLAQLVARHPERAGEALAVVAEHLDEIQREAALLALAPVLPEPSLDESVALALETGAWKAVGTLARRLDGPRRDAAIAHARSETTGWGRIALAAAAPPDVLVELVCEELEDGFRGSIAEPLRRARRRPPAGERAPDLDRRAAETPGARPRGAARGHRVVRAAAPRRGARARGRRRGGRTDMALTATDGLRG